MPILSIVMPVYNARNTLEKSVGSVLDQDLRDIELIIVDDGSTDGSGELADKVAQCDSRVTVIHKINEGCYKARISGFSVAKAEYITSIDADDAVLPCTYTKLVGFAKKYNLDIAQCDWVGAPTNGLAPELFLTKQDVIKLVCRPRLIDGEDSVFVWDKVYRRELLTRKWRDVNVTMCEDVQINFQVFKDVSRIGYLHEGLYNYNINHDSSVRNFNSKYIHDFREAILVRHEFAECYGVKPDDIVLDQWIAMNTRNYFILASTSYKTTFRDRLKFTRQLIEIPEVKDAIERLSVTGCRLFPYVQLRIFLSINRAVCVLMLLIVSRLRRGLFHGKRL